MCCEGTLVRVSIAKLPCHLSTRDWFRVLLCGAHAQYHAKGIPLPRWSSKDVPPNEHIQCARCGIHGVAVHEPRTARRFSACSLLADLWACTSVLPRAIAAFKHPRDLPTVPCHGHACMACSWVVLFMAIDRPEGPPSQGVGFLSCVLPRSLNPGGSSRSRKCRIRLGSNASIASHVHVAFAFAAGAGIGGRGAMSWQEYVDEQLVDTGCVSSACIAGLDGVIWANQGLEVRHVGRRRNRTSATRKGVERSVDVPETNVACVRCVRRESEKTTLTQIWNHRSRRMKSGASSVDSKTPPTCMQRDSR